MPQEATQPTTTTKRWRSIFGIIGTLIAIRVLLAPWFWPLATAIGVIWAWDYLLKQFPDHKRLVNIVLVVVTVLATGPYLYSFVAPYNERSADAGQRRLLFWDLWRSEKMDPAMLKSRNELSDQLQWLEDRIGEEHEAKLATIRANYTAGRITAAEAWKQTEEVQEEARKYQKEANQISSLITASNPASASGPGQASSRSRHILTQVEVSPNRETLVSLPPATAFDCRAPGWLEYILPGRTVRVEDGSNLPVGTIPTSFRLRGQAGTVYFYEAN